MSRSDFTVLGIYAFFGAFAAVIAIALGAAWWGVLLAAIIAPPAFTYIAGVLVANSIISYLSSKGR